MKKIAITYFLFFTSGLSIAQNFTTILPSRKEFFPLALGNTYIYAQIAEGKNLQSNAYDTVVVVDKTNYLDFTVYRFNNEVDFYEKSGKIYTSYPTWDPGRPGLNLTFHAPLKDTTTAYTESECSAPNPNFIQVKRLPQIVIDNKRYTNCYLFTWHDQSSYYIIASGIGIVEKSVHGKKYVLIDSQLK